MPSLIQPSFAKGEFGPALYGRVDVAAYQVALRTARNAIIHPYGGASNRQGTKFLGEVGDHDGAPRLIEFQFKTTDKYLLEFGHEYMRVIRDNGHVLEAAVNITGVTQANPGVVTAVAHGWADGDEVYIAGVVGMTQVNSRRFRVNVLTADTFQLLDQVDGVTGINTTGYTAYTSGGTASRVFTLVTPYQQADLDELTYVQDADVMTLTHQGYPTRELTRSGHTSWTLTEAAFGPSIAPPEGHSVTANTVGATTYLYKVTAVSALTEEESLSALNLNEFVVTNAVVAAKVAGATGTIVSDATSQQANAFDDITGNIQTAANSATKTSATTFYVGKDWGAGNTKTINGFQIWGSSDQGFVNGANPNVTITLRGSTDGAAWDTLYTSSTTADSNSKNVSSFSGITTSTAYRYHSLLVTQSGAAATMYIAEAWLYDASSGEVTLVFSSADNYLDGDEIQVDDVVGMTELNGGRFLVADVSGIGIVTLLGVDGSSYAAYVSGGIARRTFVRITNGNAVPDNTNFWTAVDGASRYNVYKYDNGTYGFIGETEALSFRDDNITPDLSLSPPQQRDPFVAAGNYPGAASYFEQRRVFGGTLNRPDTSFYTQPGAPDNLNVSVPLKDDDAITATLSARQVNEIRHYVPGNDLLVFTSGAEWKVNSGPDSAFSPTTIRQKPQSEWGCGHLRPLTVGTVTLFAEENHARVRSIGYSLQIDGYTGNNMSKLAPHLLQTRTIRDWAYCHSPDSRVYMAGSDGEALTMTFDAEEEVVAWTHWDTDGKFERVATLRHGGAQVEDTTYWVVRRKIGGRWVRYIEYQPTRVVQDIRDSYFVDAGLSYDSPIAIEDVSSADPVVITATGHGLSNGTEVDLSDIIWTPTFDAFDNPTYPQHLNNARYTVANATADTFELSGVDGSAFAAYVEGGNIRVPVLTLTNMWHLEGRTVIVLADGAVVRNKTITNGTLTLDTKASRIHAGLKYISDLETLNVEAQTQGQTLQGKKTKVPSVTIRFEASRGCAVGPSSDKLTDMRAGDFLVAGNAFKPFTGDIPQTIYSDWNSNGRVFLRQRDPLPMGILAIIPEIQIGG